MDQVQATALMPLGVVGIGVLLLLAFLAVSLHFGGVAAAKGMRCANCGRPRDATWPYCPYCEYDKPAIAPPRVPSYDLPPTPIAPPPGETMALDANGNVLHEMPPTPGTRILKAHPQVLAYLVLRTGVHQGKTFQLSDSTSLGRQADVNDIVLDDDSVSRQHARIRCEDSKYTLTDLGTSNRTFIQDPPTGEWKKIQQRQLVNGMTIKFGETIMTFMEIKTEKEA